MKPQDIGFLALLIVLAVVRRPRLVAAAGLLCLAAAIPLYAYWVFFTAQRLVMYGAAFLLVAVVWMRVRPERDTPGKGPHTGRGA